jgi:ribosomal protein S18 acetylase RimI-like enzyme
MISSFGEAAGVPDISGVSVRPLTPGDFWLADRLLADAFADNAITRMLFGSGDARDRLRVLYRRMVRNRHGSGLIAEIDGQPAGALISSDSPHCEPDGAAGIGFMLDAVRTMRCRILTTLGLFRETARNHPKWEHRHLSILGVPREFQSRGIGSALLREFCRQADEAGKSCYLETDSEGGRRLYERFGFHVVNSESHGRTLFIYMWRQAAELTVAQDPADEISRPHRSTTRSTIRRCARYLRPPLTRKRVLWLRWRFWDGTYGGFWQGRRCFLFTGVRLW